MEISLKEKKEEELDSEIELLNKINKDLKTSLSLKDRDYKSAVELIKIQDQLSIKSAYIIKRTLKNKYF